MGMKFVNWTVFVFVIVGAINWGLVGAFDWNMLAVVFAAVPGLLKVVYVLIGLAGLYKLFYHFVKKG